MRIGTVCALSTVSLLVALSEVSCHMWPMMCCRSVFLGWLQHLAKSNAVAGAEVRMLTQGASEVAHA